jgi:lipoprotein NlpI
VPLLVYEMLLSDMFTIFPHTPQADVWYNLGHIAIGVGDLGLGYQAFKIAVSVDPQHAESYNNLGVLELRKGEGKATLKFNPEVMELSLLKKGEEQKGKTVAEKREGLTRIMDI